MGIIRKTLSISTLGIVSFRSNKELLRRADKARRAAETELDREQSARSEADRRVAEAERRVRLAELAALREAKSAARASGKGASRASRRRSSRRSKGAQLAGAKDMIGDLVAAAQPVVADTAEAAGRRARKAGKAARKAAAQAQHEAGRRGRRARKRVSEVEATIAPRVEATLERAEALKDEVVDRTSSVVADLRDRAEDVATRG